MHLFLVSQVHSDHKGALKYFSEQDRAILYIQKVILLQHLHLNLQ